MTDDRYALSTVRRSLNLLRHLEASARALTLSELAALEEVSPSMTLRCLRTLEAGGFVQRDERKCYSALTGADRQVGLARGIDVLEVVATSGAVGMSAPDLVARLGRSEIQIGEALEIFSANGMVVHDPYTGNWKISGGMIRFLRPVMSDNFLSGTIRPLMRDLLSTWNETISWFVPVGSEQVVVEVLPSPHSVRFVLEAGARFPCYVGSAGKAQLSTLPPEVLAQYLAELDPVQVTRFRVDPLRLREEIAVIRHRGYAMSVGERVEGAASVAVPVAGPDGSNQGVISVMMPYFRTSSAELARIGEDLVARIDRLLGAPPVAAVST